MWKETNTAEILFILCKIGVSEKYPEKQLGPSATLGKLQATAEKLYLITDASVNFRKISLQLSLYKLSHEKTKETEKAIIKSPLLS